ncbi:hypothetical protein KAJ89_05885 [Candidatus Parcubacteria bacterium]|nr:hypothetical protein [Candidatus Parcubacteria bacterium]
MKISKHVIAFFILLSLAILTLSFQPVMAGQTLWDSQDSGIKDQLGQAFDETGSPTDVRTITGNVIKVFLAFLAIIFTVLIIAAGYKWMTAGGNETRLAEAKAQIRTGIIGFIIILCAYAITEFVYRNIEAVLTEPFIIP